MLKEAERCSATINNLTNSGAGPNTKLNMRLWWCPPWQLKGQMLTCLNWLSIALHITIWLFCYAGRNSRFVRLHRLIRRMTLNTLNIHSWCSSWAGVALQWNYCSAQQCWRKSKKCVLASFRFFHCTLTKNRQRYAEVGQFAQFLMTGNSWQKQRSQWLHCGTQTTSVRLDHQMEGALSQAEISYWCERSSHCPRSFLRWTTDNCCA